MWLPPEITREMEQETLRHQAEVEALPVLAEEMREYERELKAIDPDLTLIWAPETVEIPGVEPGRFHVLRPGQKGAPPSVIPLEGPDGSFRPLGAWIFDFLRTADLWNDQVTKDREDRRARLASSAQRAREREREERQEEITGRIKAATNPSVLFDKTWKAA